MKRKLIILLLGGLALRVALAVRLPFGTALVAALGWGLLADLGLAFVLAQPPFSARRPLARWALRLGAALVWFGWLVLLLGEYFYFAEFGTRPDHLVIDYVLYTAEVTGNVWESYPVAPLLSACAVLAAAAVGWVERGGADARLTGLRRLWPLGAGLALFVLSAWLPAPMADRTLRELAANGPATLAAAAWTGELDYTRYYRTLPPEAALGQAREVVRQDPEFGGFVGEGLRRRVEPAGPPRDLNVVLVLEESLGVELTGRATPELVAEGRGGAPESWTPNFDRLAAEGLLFSRFYATGTRTARALEGAIASFPPIPGNAIVRWSRQHGLDTLASVLKARGYRTVFLYGGGLGFDNMKAFLAAHGFDEAREKACGPGADAGKPPYVTAWGCADEHLFDAALEELRRAKGQKLFLALLTVSNHRPFRFPTARVAGGEALTATRQGATRYADWALGRFFDGARQEGLAETALFAVLGDHGPRSYLRERLPPEAHRVPFLLWGPSFLPRETRSTVGSSVDVAPTILGVLGRPYEASFFGRNLLRVPDAAGFALLQNKRDLGFLTDRGLTVLGLNGQNDFVPAGARTPATPLHAADPALERQAIGLYQSAYELYSAGRLGSPTAEAGLAATTE